MSSIDILSMKEREEPELNVRRSWHSSSALGDAVYVFCGKSIDYDSCNSIEKLEPDSPAKKWQLFMFETSIFPNRYDCLSATLNENEILIFSGECETKHNYSTKGIFTFNTSTNTLAEIQKDKVDGLSF